MVRWLLLIMLLVLVGCGPSSGFNKKRNSDYVWLLRYDVKTYDPAAVQDWTTGHVLSYVYEPIGKVCQISTSDSRTFILNLNSVTFSNDQLISSEDIRFTLERCLDPKIQSSIGNLFASQIVGAKDQAEGKTEHLIGITLLKPTKVQIELEAPDTAFKDKLSNISLAVLNHKIVKRDQPLSSFPAGAGTGAYKVFSFSQGVEWILQNRELKNRIQFRFIGDSATRRNLYDTGQADYAMFAAHEIGVVKGHKNLTAGGPETRVYVQMNPTKAPYLTPELRRYLASIVAKSRNEIPTLLDNQVTPLYSMLSEPPVETSPELTQVKSKAKLELVFADIGMQNPVAEYIVTLWRKQGLNATGRAMVSGALLERNARSEIALLFTGWQPDFPGPLNTIPYLLHSKSPENHSGFSSKEVDALIEKAQRGENSEANIQRALELAQKDIRIIPLYIQRDLVLERTPPPKPGN